MSIARRRIWACADTIIWRAWLEREMRVTSSAHEIHTNLPCLLPGNLCKKAIFTDLSKYSENFVQINFESFGELKDLNKSFWGIQFAILGDIFGHAKHDR